MLLAACAPSPAAEPSADEIRSSAASAMAEVRSFRFTLEVLNGTMPLGAGLDATSIEGAAVGPDRLALTVRARAASMPVEMRVVGVGSRQLVTSPLTGAWQDASGSLTLPRLLDADVGIAGVLRHADGLERRGRATKDGIDAYQLGGAIRADALARLVGSDRPATSPVQAELWIGAQDRRLRRAKLVGAVVAGETASLERVFTLSGFDEAIQIEAPG